ncbi:hypothetical protein ACFLSS_03775 [Bacteroidota bacterium]
MKTNKGTEIKNKSAIIKGFYFFNVELAFRFGLRESILLQHIIYWIHFNTRRKSAAHFRDGKYWTYLSMKDLSNTFPFWTERQIRTIIDSLVKNKAVIKGPYGRKLYYKATWYTVNDEFRTNTKYVMSKRKKAVINSIEQDIDENGNPIEKKIHSTKVHLPE